MTVLKQQIARAVHVLKTGGIIAYPTEAIYGIGCDPDNFLTIKNLLKIKRRPVEKGLILISHNFTDFKPYLSNDPGDYSQLSVQQAQQKAIEQKGITWLFPKKSNLSDLITGGRNTVAVRVSNHPIVKMLCESFAKAIVSTSANLSDNEPAKTVEAINSQFDDSIGYIVEAPLGNNKLPSTIKHIETDQIIRYGN